MTDTTRTPFKFLASNTRTVVLALITAGTAVWAYLLTAGMDDPDTLKMPKFWVAALLNAALGLFVWWLTNCSWTR